MVDARLLAKVPLFADLDDADLHRLGDELRARRYRKGETIFVTGDPGTSLCVIESGRVKLALLSVEGREVILDLLGPGDVFGELALLDGEPRSADAVAVTPELVNLCETNRRGNYSGSDTSPGLLIQAAPGNGGGTGAWRTKRSGCAA